MEKFTEELRLTIDDNDLFKEYDLGNMYSVCEKGNYEKACTVCNLKYHGNEDNFYCRKITYCKNCYRKASRQRARRIKLSC